MSSKKENDHMSLISITSILSIPVVVICFFWYLDYVDQSKTTTICAKNGVVTSIDSVYHRTVYFTVNNDIKIEISQPTINVGDPFCLVTDVIRNEDGKTIKSVKHFGIVDK